MILSGQAQKANFQQADAETRIGLFLSPNRHGVRLAFMTHRTLFFCRIHEKSRIR